jgi:acetyl esterase/lipase
MCLRLRILLHAGFLLPIATAVAEPSPTTLKLWPGTPPGDENVTLPPEADQTKPEDRLIAGRPIIKLGNVSTPLIEVHRPPAGKANGTSVIVCPGGGHYILAWDLEGTEVAAWLNTLGVTAIVLKYRVPSRTRETQRWQAAVQDAQRAVRLVRANAANWQLDPQRIGILGFSAGGETAALATLLYSTNHYAPIDESDRVSARPDFALLIYAAGLYDEERKALARHVVLPDDTPPFFFAHAWDDRVSVQNALMLGSALKDKGVPASLHLYPTGGHGYGLRPTEDPVTTWPARAEEWMRHAGWLERR